LPLTLLPLLSGCAPSSRLAPFALAAGYQALSSSLTYTPTLYTWAL
jgi:hypothetical protein